MESAVRGVGFMNPGLQSTAERENQTEQEVLSPWKYQVLKF